MKLIQGYNQGSFNNLGYPTPIGIFRYAKQHKDLWRSTRGKVNDYTTWLQNTVKVPRRTNEID
ncbi:hypothetical protein 12VC501_gene0048 [Vibrio phage 12VC501]|nr:hypothetical protein 12VC501_gene0048 [Vibrio phage 12VC501]